MRLRVARKIGARSLKEMIDGVDTVYRAPTLKNSNIRLMENTIRIFKQKEKENPGVMYQYAICDECQKERYEDDVDKEMQSQGNGIYFCNDCVDVWSKAKIK
jgi:hypothetical protein